MATIGSIESGVQNRLEELPQGGFWDLQNELRPLIVEAMFAATLITGDQQIKPNVVFTIPQGSATPPLFAPLAMPADALALLRVDGAQGVTIDKCFVWDLDRSFPGWETQTGPQAQYWFPFGLTQFGIYPSLTAPQQVRLTYIQNPVPTARPYTGNEVIPLQSEFLQSLEDYASSFASLKEGGPEFDQAQIRLQRFLRQMQELSNFAYRRGSLRFSRLECVESKI